MSKGAKITLWVILVLVAGFGLIQLVPYGRDHTNPPVTNEYQWQSAEAEAIARKACYDCHSNETVWPWYTNVAPSSWLIQWDVDQGRDNLNFSERPEGAAIATDAIGAEIGEIVGDGEMPPFQYKIIHGDARLSDAERQLLVDEFGAR